MAAIVGTLGVPVLLALRSRPAERAPSTMVAVNVTHAVHRNLGAADARGAPLWIGLDVARLNVPLVVGWGAASVALTLLLLGVSLAQRRASRRWPTQCLDGTRVLVAPDVGPLVSGLWRLQIVLPRWALERSSAEQRMMLTHEEEHRRARDPNLLLLGVLATVLVPWNVALWWQLRRLRLAIETDCDRRVLDAGADVHGYGSLLLDVGSRSVRQFVLAGAAFSETPSLLERRIEVMTAPAPRHPVARAFALGTVAAGALALACAAPRPAAIRPSATPERIFPPLAIRRPAMAYEQPYTHEQMVAAIARYFPGVRGNTDQSALRFVLDADGRVVSTSRGPIAGRLVAFDSVEYTQIEHAGPGLYGPDTLHLVVVWLKPDSLIGEHVPGAGFSVVTSARRAPSDTGATLEQVAPVWFQAHPDLLRGLGVSDTAYVWFVMDRADHVARFGRTGSEVTLRDEAHVSQAAGWWSPKVRFPPGVVAGGMVVVTAWWPR
jgi:hypothetical protein